MNHKGKGKGIASIWLVLKFFLHPLVSPLDRKNNNNEVGRDKAV